MGGTTFAAAASGSFHRRTNHSASEEPDASEVRRQAAVLVEVNLNLRLTGDGDGIGWWGNGRLSVTESAALRRDHPASFQSDCGKTGADGGIHWVGFSSKAAIPRQIRFGMHLSSVWSCRYKTTFLPQVRLRMQRPLSVRAQPVSGSFAAAGLGSDTATAWPSLQAGYLL